MGLATPRRAEGLAILDGVQQLGVERSGDNGRARLKLRLFGQMAVEDQAGRSYLPRTRKTRALLAILRWPVPSPFSGWRSHPCSGAGGRRSRQGPHYVNAFMSYRKR